MSDPVTPWNLRENEKREVWAMLAYGVPDRDIAAAIRIPWATWIEWTIPRPGEVVSPEQQWWRGQVDYYRGRGVAERIRTIADPLPPKGQGSGKEGGLTLVDVAAAKLRADTARWLLSRQRSGEYGSNGQGRNNSTDIRIGINNAPGSGPYQGPTSGAARELDHEGSVQIVAVLEAFGMPVPDVVRQALGIPVPVEGGERKMIEVESRPVPAAPVDAEGGGGDPPVSIRDSPIP